MAKSSDTPQRAALSRPTAHPAEPKASEAIANRIRAMIGSGEVRAGDALPSETVLMETYGVARPTMREAIRILESDGLVRVKRGVGGGARVQSLDSSVIATRAGLYLQIAGADLHDLIEAQSIIEPGAAALAATRRTEQMLGAMRLCVEQLSRSTTGDDLARSAADFHLLVLRAAGNKTLGLVSEILQHLLEVEYAATSRRLFTGASLERVTAETVVWFGDLVDFIEAGDADGAADHWRRHQQWVLAMRKKRRR